MVKHSERVIVSTYTNGILDPEQEMLGPVRDGGIIEAMTMPGCWGPMITPHLRGGHEVTRPVAVENAEPGDAVAIKIREITVSSKATASGQDRVIDGYFLGDPFVAKKCPECGTMHPSSTVEGIGQDAIRCAECGTPLTPFQFEHGYTVVFDDRGAIGLTVDKAGAEKIARDARTYAGLSDSCTQHSILLFAPHDLVGTVSRMRPFMGQLGTTPAVRMPDSHNAGDFGVFLIGAPHEYALTEKQLEMRTDGHMDIDAVRPGTIVIAPVKVPGAGVYMGDMHALQGDGEIAGHTMDVAGTVTVQVHVVKNRPLDGPVIFPLTEDLPYLARPMGAGEREKALAMAKEWGLSAIEESAPVSVVGTGADLNKATDNGLHRAAKLLGMSVPEVRNRATITGAIEIGRLPGVIQVTFLAPLPSLEKAGLLPFVREQYNIG
ncbi:MAG: acetamidase/formamidase family protein [Deltaproteobacteria bacterium]|nr:acetamidase/formamidase family protein [Deltaproteobacteria bacterium]MBN2687830.1 acetamidase/formamidase family protein [Deltaproteobacteria bacterium]